MTPPIYSARTTGLNFVDLKNFYSDYILEQTPTEDLAKLSNEQAVSILKMLPMVWLLVTRQYDKIEPVASALQAKEKGDLVWQRLLTDSASPAIAALDPLVASTEMRIGRFAIAFYESVPFLHSNASEDSFNATLFFSFIRKMVGPNFGLPFYAIDFNELDFDGLLRDIQGREIAKINFLRIAHFNNIINIVSRMPKGALALADVSTQEVFKKFIVHIFSLPGAPMLEHSLASRQRAMAQIDYATEVDGMTIANPDDLPTDSQLVGGLPRLSQRDIDIVFTSISTHMGAALQKALPWLSDPAGRILSYCAGTGYNEALLSNMGFDVTARDPKVKTEGLWFRENLYYTVDTTMDDYVNNLISANNKTLLMMCCPPPEIQIEGIGASDGLTASVVLKFFSKGKGEYFLYIGELDGEIHAGPNFFGFLKANYDQVPFGEDGKELIIKYKACDGSEATLWKKRPSNTG